jgi:CHASE2 domain-containing sensor protein
MNVAFIYTLKESEASGVKLPQYFRPFLLMALAMLALLAALWAGLMRLGWGWPPLRPTLTAAGGQPVYG